MKIFIIGFMGSGKTHWGRIWAANNGLDFFDLDELIEKNENRTIAVIFEEQGENYFREKESEMLRRFREKDHFLLACGGGSPCFGDNMKWMNQHGNTVYLSASPQYITENIATEKDKRPLLKNVKPGEILFFIEQKLNERKPFYDQSKFIIPVNELDENSLSALHLINFT